jgi:hypothetical protein
MILRHLCRGLLTLGVCTLPCIVVAYPLDGL